MNELAPQDPTPLLIADAEHGYAESGLAGSEDLEHTVFDIIWIAGYRTGEDLPRIVERYCRWHNDYYRRIRPIEYEDISEASIRLAEAGHYDVGRVALIKLMGESQDERTTNI